MSGPDYIVDIDGIPADQNPDTLPNNHPPQHRPWLAIHWRCCSVYSRVYRNQDTAAYDGRCPRCGRPVHIPVGQGGTHHRFFDAY